MNKKNQKFKSKCKELVSLVVLEEAHVKSASNMLVFLLKESKGVDEDGDQEHRSHGEVLQRQNHHRVRHRGVGRRADRPEDPASERAAGGHRRNGPIAEENVKPPRDRGLPSRLRLCFQPLTHPGMFSRCLLCLEASSLTQSTCLKLSVTSAHAVNQESAGIQQEGSKRVACM